MSRKCMHLYINEYFADTDHLTTAEHGAYMLLRMVLHRKGALPEKDYMCRRITGMTEAEWEASRATIMALFEVRDRRGTTAHDRALGAGRFRPAIPSSLRQRIHQRDGGRCAYCGAGAGPFHLDHRLPWSRGGKTDEENLVLACVPCNLSKGALSDDEFIGRAS